MSADGLVHITAFTHQGRVRESNEDTIAAGGWLCNASMSAPQQWRYDLDIPHLCVIADGMGGHAAGEVASEQAVKRLVAEAAHLVDADGVCATLERINAELYAAMSHDPSRLGMGTTIVGLLLIRDRLVWFNVGDSRLYRHQNGSLSQISVDDALIKPFITQSLGGMSTFRPISPHVGAGDLPVPSRWLLCSDGLTDMLDDDNIERCLASDDREAVSALFDLAMAVGGHDNISIILVSVAADEPR